MNQVMRLYKLTFYTESLRLYKKLLVIGSFCLFGKACVCAQFLTSIVALSDRYMNNSCNSISTSTLYQSLPHENTALDSAIVSLNNS
jgi:hypothetical protein